MEFVGEQSCTETPRLMKPGRRAVIGRMREVVNPRMGKVHLSLISSKHFLTSLPPQIIWRTQLRIGLLYPRLNLGQTHTSKKKPTRRRVDWRVLFDGQTQNAGHDLCDISKQQARKPTNLLWCGKTVVSDTNPPKNGLLPGKEEDDNILIASSLQRTMLHEP